MKKVRISFIAFVSLVFLLSAFSVFAAKINSTSYKQTVIVSVGGENMSSSSYKMSTAIGIINRIISSASYINKLGFFYTWKLADNQPCTSDNQCEGGFCCSSLCSSSACPSEEPAPSGGGTTGGGGGGGGGGVIVNVTPTEKPRIKDFSISTSSIKEQLILGAAKTTTITIKNTGDTALNFDLSVVAVDEFVFLSDISFSLEPNEEKIVEANIIGKKLGSYLGEIKATADGIEKSISAVIEVESELVLFDVKMDIPTAYKKVEAGGELKAQITLLNVGPAREVDVATTYIIKDKRGSIIYEASETFAVDKQTSFVKSFKISENLEPGDYLAIIEVRYANSFAVSSDMFRVVPKEVTIVEKVVKSNIAIALTFIVFVGLMFLFAYLLLPKIKMPGRLGKCLKAIEDIEEAISRNGIAKARKLYVKARKLYINLEDEDKKEIYKRLTRLYNKLK